MNTNRTFVEQFATFWFNIDKPLPAAASEGERRADEDDPHYEAQYPIWERATTVLEQTHREHPAFIDRVVEGRETFDIPNWEFCEQHAEAEEASDGTLVWPISFFTNHRPLSRELLAALRDLCRDALERHAEGATIRYVRTETQTEFRDVVTETVEEAGAQA